MSTLSVLTVLGAQQFQKFTDKGNVTGSVTINPVSDGGDVKFTMTGNTTVAFTTTGIPSGYSAVCSVNVLGAFTVSWPAGIIWPTGGIPAYTAPSIYTFQFRNNGGTIQIFGFQSGKGMAAV